jgi:hypothetical protein
VLVSHKPTFESVNSQLLNTDFRIVTRWRAHRDPLAHAAGGPIAVMKAVTRRLARRQVDTRARRGITNLGPVVATRWIACAIREAMAGERIAFLCSVRFARGCAGLGVDALKRARVADPTLGFIARLAARDLGAHTVVSHARRSVEPAR